MRLWNAPARALPVTVRPLGGETVLSYARRLSEANDLRPTTIMRALGQLSCGSGYHLLDRDAWLNEQALDRLETYPGISRERLARALPALRQQPSGLPLPAGRPALHLHQPSPRARPACRRCRLLASGSSGAPVMVLPGASPLVCHRHKRWLGTPSETAQHDLSAAGEILTATRRRDRLLARSPDRNWAAGIFQAAWSMTQDWTECEPRRMPVFSQRWRDRAATFGIAAEKRPPPVVTLPEAVTLTAILTDLSWRRYVALEWDARPFYQHVADGIGEQSYPRFFLRNDPIRRWIEGHRARFSEIRLRHWSHPTPEIRHFK
ncbi:MAG: hypothetical protein ACRDPY_36410 [Streptosporangiaceae bacterium]